jgi:hypothetical protein
VQGSPIEHDEPPDGRRVRGAYQPERAPKPWRVDTRRGARRASERSNHSRSRHRSAGHPADTPGKTVLMDESECPVGLPSGWMGWNERVEVTRWAILRHPDSCLRNPIATWFDEFRVSRRASCHRSSSGPPVPCCRWAVLGRACPGVRVECPEVRRTQSGQDGSRGSLEPYRHLFEEVSGHSARTALAAVSAGFELIRRRTADTRILGTSVYAPRYVLSVRPVRRGDSMVPRTVRH